MGNTFEVEVWGQHEGYDSEYSYRQPSDDVVKDALTWSKRSIVELCQSYGHPLPAHTLALIDAAMGSNGE